MTGRARPAGVGREPAGVGREPDQVGRGPDGDGVEVSLGPSPAAGGDAIGHLPDGRVVFVEGALPGERVEVALTADRRDYARARLLTVLDASPDRIEPPCPWVGRGCGGCGWQHLDPRAQVRAKEAVVVDSLRRLAHVDAATLLGPAVATPTGGYRTTVHLGVDADGRPAYHRRHGHELVAVEGCAVVHPRLAELIEGVRVAGTQSVTLRVGVAGGERLVILDSPETAPRRSPRRGPGRVKGRSGVRGRDGGERAAEVTEAPGDAVIVGPGEEAAFHEEVAGRRWRVSARSFFQAGPAGADALAALVDEAVGPLAPGARLVDLYAGVGLLGGALAARRPGVVLTAVESDLPAVADARANLADLDATVIGAEVGTWAPLPAEVVVADPARPGLGRPGVGAAVATGCSRLVLVSCDPASFARDVALLAQAGYGLRGVRVVDLFPQTSHVETVSIFEQDV